MTRSAALALVLVAGIAAAAPLPADAGPDRGVRLAARRFPAFGALVGQLATAEVAVVGCDRFGSPDDGCTEEQARDLSAATRLLAPRPGRAGAATWSCTAPAVWLGAASRAERFDCAYAGEDSTAELAFACEEPGPDAARACFLAVTTANQDETYRWRWTFTVTGSRRSPVLGPVLVELAVHN